MYIRKVWYHQVDHFRPQSFEVVPLNKKKAVCCKHNPLPRYPT